MPKEEDIKKFNEEYGGTDNLSTEHSIYTEIFCDDCGLYCQVRKKTDYDERAGWICRRCDGNNTYKRNWLSKMLGNFLDKL